VVQAEAKIVRTIFALYLEVSSIDVDKPEYDTRAEMPSGVCAINRS